MIEKEYIYTNVEFKDLTIHPKIILFIPSLVLWVLAIYSTPIKNGFLFLLCFLIMLWSFTFGKIEHKTERPEYDMYET